VTWARIPAVAAVHIMGCTDRFSGMTVMGTDAARGAGWPWRRLAARRRRGVAMAAIGAVAAGLLAFGLAGCGSGSSSPGTTVVRNGEAWLQGEITQDTCYMGEAHPPIGDVGCSITVNGYEVSVVPGNARLPGKRGTVTGLDASRDQTGGHAAIYAQLTGPHSASVLSAPKYYARISS
jgi:hypothetical protein